MSRKFELNDCAAILNDIHENAVNLDTREIFLSQYPFQDTGSGELDQCTALRFISSLRFLNSMNDDPILVHQIMMGGEWNYGMAIYDAIIASRSYITVLAYAWARSMSSVIPQAADFRVITPNSEMMLHYGKVYMQEDSVGAQAEAEWNKHLDKVMLEIYADSCENGQYFKDREMNRSRIKAELDRKMKSKHEVYLTARESVEWGLMDAVLGDDGAESIEALLKD